MGEGEMSGSRNNMRGLIRLLNANNIELRKLIELLRAENAALKQRVEELERKK